MKKIILLSLFTSFVLASCLQAQKKMEATENKQETVVNNIMNRRSIRAYKPQQVEKSKIDTIMLCAVNAPSANNKQPWEVRVIQNQELLNKIKVLNENIFHNSPTVIVVARDTTNNYSALDCGLLTQNILLSAESMDLGTCPLGGLGRLLESPEAKEIKDALKLPEGYEVILAISLGYKDQVLPTKTKDITKVQYID